MSALGSGAQVLALLERIKLQAAGKVEPPPITLSSRYGYEDDEDDDEDDSDDEGDADEGTPETSRRRRGQGSSQSQAPSARGRGRSASKDADEDSEDEDGFVDLDEEDDEDVDKKDLPAGEGGAPVRRVLAPLSTEGGFFGFAEPGKFQDEPSLSLGELRAGSTWDEGSGSRPGSKGKGQGKRKSKR